MRFRSNVQRLLLYATFIALSVALHMLVILGTRPAADDAESAAAVGSASASVESTQ